MQMAKTMMDAGEGALEAVSTTAVARRRAYKSIEDKAAAVESKFKRLERCAQLNAAGTYAIAIVSSSLNLEVRIRCSKMTANINVSGIKHCSKASLKSPKMHCSEPSLRFQKSSCKAKKRSSEENCTQESEAQDC